MGVVLQCERKLTKLVKSMDTLKGKLDGQHTEHGRLKTEEQVWWERKWLGLLLA